MSTPTPARRVVEAFGDCDALASMYTDVTWRLNHSLAPNIACPHVGKDAVCGFNTAVLYTLGEDHGGDSRRDRR